MVLSLTLFQTLVLVLALLLAALAFGIRQLPAGRARDVARVLTLAAWLGFPFGISHAHRLLAPCMGVRGTVRDRSRAAALGDARSSLRALTLGSLVAMHDLVDSPGRHHLLAARSHD